MMKLLNSPAIRTSAISNSKFLPSDLDEFCDRLKLLLQEQQFGKNSDIINKKNFVIIDNYQNTNAYLRKIFSKF